ncbi:Flp pilus assembly protein TadG [Duganella sp. CF517]|uniref:pilus assembly protein TadG-related protein n=1 Tax=Duganella sp. CF517 TaxID=1881038 RepID=UPI0008AE2B7B|nr:pilus assembly protein TadG-related protein [Duganella sp. CF517]SEN09514.1 Flp pilus assembly protein TadG [Duganella sp. CF517]
MNQRRDNILALPDGDARTAALVPKGLPFCRRQRGAIAIVFCLMLAVLIGFIGVALDLSRVYNRRIELQGIANAAALAAAGQLNGTTSGIDNALLKASAAISLLKFQYNQSAITWDSAALSFSASPDGGWVDAATAQGAPDGLLYVRVDTDRLGASMGTIELIFMRVIADSLVSADASVVSVAGRSTIDVTPLAVCALSNAEATSRANPGPPANAELVQYGFRRGVAYDLMKLNPNSTTAENFVVDPFSLPGTSGVLSNVSPAFVGPYVCTGQLGIPRVRGGTITVGRPFPLASLYNQLNSRFDQYSGSFCSHSNAPPDVNIKSYVSGTATPWMGATPAGQGAQTTTVEGKLWTVADPSVKPAGTTAAMYGPLWAYARAVPYSSYVAGATEPVAGYAAFTTSAWSTLYGPAAPAATGTYHSGTSMPYKATIGSTVLAPSSAHKGIANRRVLNIALLSCPVDPGALAAANVLAIGKFLMTVPATATSLYAEFGGLVADQYLGGAVELYP